MEQNDEKDFSENKVLHAGHFLRSQKETKAFQRGIFGWVNFMILGLLK